MKRRYQSIKMRGTRPMPVKVLHMEPGDTLLVSVPKVFPELRAQIMNALCRATRNPDLQVLVIDERVRMSVLRQERIEQAPVPIDIRDMLSEAG